MNYSKLDAEFKATPTPVLLEMKRKYCEDSGFGWNDVDELYAFIYHHIIAPTTIL